MYSFLVFFLVCLVELGNLRPQVNNPAVRLYGGSSASIRIYNYNVVLFTSRHDICGGAIISPKFVVSAAHCLYDIDPSDVDVCAGSSSSSCEGGIIVRVSKVIIHDGFDSLTFDYDIALVKLRVALVFGGNIGKIALPAVGEKPEDGYWALAFGWGKTLDEDEDGDEPSVLHMVSLPIETKMCIDKYEEYGALTDNMICAGGMEGRGACFSDSGGPLVIDGVLYGITSFGPESGECGVAGLPGVYASVADLRDFIIINAHV